MRVHSTDGKLSLRRLCAPIAADLARSERIFREELASERPSVQELCGYVERFAGKRLRPALLLLSARACGPVGPAHAVLAAVVEMVHVATLVHDDVLDGGDLRRQAATVNRRWGNAPAVLLGDILFSHAYRLCSQLAAPRAAQVIAQTAVTVCEGELMQIANRQNYELTEEEYLDIVAHKTAALIGACTLLGAEYAGADERTSRQMERFGRALGVAFQITDDVLDLVGSEAVVGKSLGRDAELGELTLPLIHLLREQGAGRSEVLALLRSTAAERTGRLAGLLESSGSIGYAQSQARGRLEEALSILAGLPESEARDSLRAMAEFVLSRGY